MYLARRELRAGASISEAAATVGYASESAFSNAFKRVMDVAPGQYRRTVLRDGEPPQTNSKAGTPEF
jgi:AraC-like DNA-binding protein